VAILKNGQILYMIDPMYKVRNGDVEGSLPHPYLRSQQKYMSIL